MDCQLLSRSGLLSYISHSGELLPTAARNKKARVIVKNRDDHCLHWPPCAVLFPEHHGNHAYRPLGLSDQQWSGLERNQRPHPLSQLDGWSCRTVRPRVTVYRLSKVENGQRINLLIVSNDKKHHYMWVKDLNRLLYTQRTHKEHKHFCGRCCHGFKRKNVWKIRPTSGGMNKSAMATKTDQT